MSLDFRYQPGVLWLTSLRNSFSSMIFLLILIVNHTFFNDYNMFRRKIKSWRRERYPGRKEHEENKEPEDQNQPDLTVS